MIDKIFGKFDYDPEPSFYTHSKLKEKEGKALLEDGIQYQGQFDD